MKFILGKKIGMTQLINDKGIPQPATVIEAGPCYISQIKTKDKKDGYQAVQLAFGEKKKIGKSATGHLKKAKINKNLKFLVEYRTDKPEKYKPGQEIKADVFEKGDIVDVVGTSKGKGFAGVIKRHGFSRGPETHGSHHHRGTGSIGSMFPQRVIKGKKMPGHMGAERVTTKNLEILKVDPEKNLLVIKGAVPGPAKSLVQIKEVV